VFFGFISLFQNQEITSLTSLLLVLFVYFPFLFDPISGAKSDIFFKPFFTFLLACIAFAGLCQFLVQFFYSPPWLFDYKPFLPDWLQNKMSMNTVIPISFFNKSNGFFLLEPSIFSQYMSIGFYCSSYLTTGFFIKLAFLSGLICSFSGTGMILFSFVSAHVFLFGSLYKRLVILILLSCFFWVNIVFLPGFLSSRVSEFGSGATLATSSAAARFLNPLIIVNDSFTHSSFKLLLGNGPGAIQREVKDFSFHDPTWAKLLLEYGLLGTFLFLLFLFFSLRTFFYLYDPFLLLLFGVQYFFLGVGFLTADLIAVLLIYTKFSIILSEALNKEASG
jgi:hypothetical protein